MPRLQTGGGRTQEARKERGCTEAEKAKGKEMTETLDDMKHHPAAVIFALLVTLATVGACCGLPLWVMR